MTPRRILLLMGGLFAFGVAYALYARLFGWLDGLPILPPRMLEAADGKFRPPPRATSPTIERLKEAFGAESPETEPAFYPTQLEFRNGDSSIVLAAGSPPSAPNSNRVTLKPFSVAIFGKQRPQHLLGPGEVNEISTFHSDLAVLEFDRVIQTATEMNNAKLVRLELISDPEQALPDRLGRRGLVHITNNQRSADPNRFLVLKTVGPVFYRDPKYATGPALLGPDVWTDSPVEIVDRSNLPRRPGTAAAVAPGAADVFRNPAAVAEVLGGQRLPPPTITAVGMRVYLEPDDPPAKPSAKNPPPKSARKGSAGFSGVRRAELLEKVVMNLWVEGGQGLVGSGGQSGVIPEPPSAAVGIGGGLLPAAHAAREFARDLLQVETRGPFNYDAEKNVARFDVVPLSDPNLPNDVRVTKVPPRTSGLQTLFSQVLEIEFNGPPTGTPQPRPAAAQPVGRLGAPQPTAAAPSPASAPKFKRLHAWTYTPGRILTVFSDADGMRAYGQDLVREQAGERTTLTGAPLLVEQDRNVLMAGGAKNPAVLTLEPPPGVPPGPDRKSQATVRGPGRVDLFDAATGTSTTSATWQTTMVQTRERSNGRDVDLFTFTDGAKFEDVQADYWLKGNVLKLWLAPPDGEAAAAAGTASRSRPHRVQAIGNVSGHSLEMDVEQAEQLNAWFKDVPPPEPAGLAPPVSSAPGPVPRDPGAPPKEPRERKQPRDPAAPRPAPGAAAADMGTPKEKDKDAEKPKPPMKLKARTIDTWVVRYPLPAPATPVAAAPAPKGNERGGGLKYQLEHARCEGMVDVHQDPDDPAKPRGTDILGSKMLIDSTPDGSVLTVFGWDTRPAEVHNEGTSLIGPKVVVDQLHNLANIEGRGSVAMVTASDLTGAELRHPDVVVIQFRDGMIFKGAQKTADFFGKVNASQGASWVVCHTMQVIFDRPVYFSQMNRPAPPTGPAAKGPNGRPADDKAKVDVIYCYPAPADAADSPQERLVSFLQVERDPQTGKPVRRQQLVARELTLRAQVREEGSAEPYKLVLADGPGVVRLWQPGARDEAGPTNPTTAPTPKQPSNVAPPPPETEMKLTVVTFSGRMIAKDKGKLYQDATFHDNIQVIHVPTDNPDLVVERHRLPPHAVLLTCTEKLIVWTHKTGGDPPVQHMEAYGNAYLQNEEYDGWGEVVTHDGKVIVFDDGSGFDRRVTNPIPARIKSRFKGNDNSGRRIIFDQATNHYQVIDSVGGTITSYPSATPPPKKTNPPPKK